MKKYISFLAIVFIFSAITSAQPAQKWRISKSTHFIVYYKNASDDFIQHLIDRCEEYYNKIADNLGFRRYNFWLWDNRAKIYIYDDAQDYHTQTGQPSWSCGHALMQEKVIHTFPYAQGFFESILPHEMGHIIFREFVGFNNPAIPLWLDEGVASYQEDLRYSSAKRIVAAAMKNGKLINLEELTKLHPQSISDQELVNLFYAEAVSAVGYLVKEFGSDNFVVFCQSLRDKQDLQRALHCAYPFGNLAEFNRAWQKYLSEATTYGTK